MSDTRAIIEESDLQELLHYLESFARLQAEDVFNRQALKLVDRVRLLQRTQKPLAFIEQDQVPLEVRTKGPLAVKVYVTEALKAYRENRHDVPSNQ